MDKTLKSIDRMARNANYSVYETLLGLRVETPFARIGIRYYDGELLVQPAPSMPKLWMLVPITVFMVSQAAGWWGFLIGVPAAIYAYQKLSALSKKKAVNDIETFREQLAEVLSEERVAASLLHWKPN
jgi:hypothetical protein